MSYIGGLAEDKELIYGDKDILIYGVDDGYGEKIYRNLVFFKKEKHIKAFIDSDSLRQGFLHQVPIISIEEVDILYPDNPIICIGRRLEETKVTTLLLESKNVHQIIYNLDCERWGTEYGGFYVPSNHITSQNFLVYSFGIGEDLSFSEEVIRRGGIVYGFDPTPKAIKYAENHRLFSNPRFHFYPYGLSDKDGEEYFYLPLRADFVSASVVQHRSVDHEHPIKVKMMTLRTIMKKLGHKKIDILKMDIEGSEFKVVHDMMRPDLDKIDFKLFCVETHERFFETRKCVDDLYSTMQENGFYDLYGTVREPTFVKL